jgi:hypothetical protein
MATELEGNVQLQRFITLLAELNHLSADIIKTGDSAILEKMLLNSHFPNVQPLLVSRRTLAVIIQLLTQKRTQNVAKKY